MSEKLNPACERCKWWLPFSESISAKMNEDFIIGSCLRYPPKWTGNVPDDYGDYEYQHWDRSNWSFPVTAPDDYCGEFQQRQDST